MASPWKWFRLNYIGTIRISRLITPVILLAGIFLIFRWARSPSYGIVRYKTHNVQHRMSQKEIEETLYNIKDTRPDHCRIAYNLRDAEQNPTVSILVDFHEEDLYNLKLTLSSIVQNTPDDLYSEIILLDDGTSTLAIREHAAEFLRNEKFMKVKPYRSSVYEGRGFTRFKSAKVAAGEILVFVSSSSVVNIGWLPPLIRALQEKETRIVIPHADNILSEGRFFQMDDNLVTTFSWPLSTIYMETSGEESGKYITSPVMRGDVLAVTKAYLETIGNYDNNMDPDGGHDIELSLRTWLCGGQILVATCSRIATHSAFKPTEITSSSNFNHIANLWLDDFKEIAHKQGRNDFKGVGAETVERKKEITRWLKCKKFDWYLSNIAKNVLVPSDDFVFYGKLKASSAYCVRSVSFSSSVLDMVLCRPYMYDPALIFEFDKFGFIKMGDKCLMAPGIGSRVVLMNCQDGNKQQQWKFDEQAQIHSAVYSNGCITHVTETIEGQIHEHHMVLKQCGDENDQRQHWGFISY